jgi:hypothetical protein
VAHQQLTARNGGDVLVAMSDFAGSTMLTDPLNAVGRTQDALLACAEQLMGPRDAAYEILKPICVADGPRLRFTPDKRAVYAELSLNAQRYWPSCVFEMAHEVVHMLNPVVGHTTEFEEAVATHFQLEIAPIFCGVQQPVTLAAYRAAREDLLALGASPFDLAQRIRVRCGSLGAVDHTALADLCPSAPEALVARLVARFQ